MPMVYFLPCYLVCGSSLALALFPSLEIQGENTALIVHMLFSRWGVARRELPSQTSFHSFPFKGRESAVSPTGFGSRTANINIKEGGKCFGRILSSTHPSRTQTASGKPVGAQEAASCLGKSSSKGVGKRSRGSRGG